MKFSSATNTQLFNKCRVNSNRKEWSWDNPSNATVVLTRAEANQLGVCFLNTNSPLDVFNVGEEIFVAILPDNRKFVVNTEGYDYARYYALLKIID